MLTECSNKNINRLLDIFNAALSSGYFPDRLKSAIINLIPKQGKSRHNPINYRPIALLETPGKLLERIISRRHRPYLEENNIHNPYQY